MPQLNEALMDIIISIIFVFLIINDLVALLDQLDDELLSYNTIILLV
jgi:hypothetical protein